MDFGYTCVLTPVLSESAELLHENSVAEASEIESVTKVAFERAFNHIGDPVLELTQEYLVTLQYAFEAAWLLEMYSKFIASCQDIEEVKFKIARMLNNKGVTFGSIYDYINHDGATKEIADEFKIFRSKATNLSPEDNDILQQMEHNLLDRARSLRDDLRKCLNEKLTPEKKISEMQKLSLIYQIESNRLLKSYEIKSNSNESWKPLFANLALILTGIGVIATIISMGVKAVRGHYLFFDAPTIRKTPADKMEFENKLLGASVRYLQRGF